MWCVFPVCKSVDVIAISTHTRRKEERMSCVREGEKEGVIFTAFYVVHVASMLRNQIIDEYLNVTG
jgi:hypothetical protein